VNRVLAGGALTIFIAAIAAIALSSVGSDGSGSPETTTVAPRRTVSTPRPAPPPKPVPVKLVAVGPYDPPPGDGLENDDEVANAVDGDPATFWSTERYSSPLGSYKPGVGIVLDAARRRRIGRVLVSTDDVGSRAQIQLADQPTGPFRVVSADKALARRTAFPLRRGASARYVLVWLTAVPTATGEAHITEVRALTR
jgi:hypothetical protein